MCLAVPTQILSLNGDMAKVELDGIQFEVNISFLETPIVGDWVIVHAGVALSKVDQETLDFYQNQTWDDHELR
jgi:hydrogenase expression/formation protein HypC